VKGHETIIAMRRDGQKPAIVFLNDFACDAEWPRFGDHATVDVSGEQPEWLDLRFLVGLRVSITGTSEKRAKRLLEACKQAGAVTVGAGTAAHVSGGRFEPGWSEIWHKFASEKTEAA
jgi:hypothetical protein